MRDAVTYTEHARLVFVYCGYCCCCLLVYVIAMSIADVVGYFFAVVLRLILLLLLCTYSCRYIWSMCLLLSFCCQCRYFYACFCWCSYCSGFCVPLSLFLLLFGWHYINCCFCRWRECYCCCRFCCCRFCCCRFCCCRFCCCFVDVLPTTASVVVMSSFLRLCFLGVNALVSFAGVAAFQFFLPWPVYLFEL